MNVIDALSTDPNNSRHQQSVAVITLRIDSERKLAQNWKAIVREHYVDALEELKRKPTSWGAYRNYTLPTADWRLWYSVEGLDITLSFITELLREARSRRKHKLHAKLKQIQQMIDRSLEYLALYGWRPRS